MIFNVKELFSEDSLLMTRYNLTDELVHKIKFFYELFRNNKKVSKDLEVVIPCVLLVLKKNGNKFDLKSEVRYLTSVYFDESEMNRRQMNIYDNFYTFADNCKEYEWYWNWKVTSNDTGLKS